MNRRSFLKNAGLATAAPILGYEGWVHWAQAAGPGNDILAELKNSITGSVLVPTSPDFPARSINFNKRTTVTPAIIALCASAGDVAASLRWARKHGFPLSVRSGGHSYEGFSLCTGLVIDVSAMNAVHVDPKSQTAVIGAGARLSQVYPALWEHGFALSGGACPSVGIAGLALGGGFGLSSRKWGLTADNLLSLEMVDASSQTLTVNAAEHPDLFWACRGAGGGHFGVATALKFRIHPVQQVALYQVEWPIAQAKQVIQAWQDWAPFAADELTCELVIGARGAMMKSAGQFLGTETELRHVLQPLVGVGTPKLKVWTSTFMDAVSYFAGTDRPKPLYLKAKSDYARQKLSSTAIDTILRNLELFSGAASGWIQFDSYGGALNRVPRDATAFFHRAGTLFSVQYNAIWSKAEAGATPMKWIRDFYAAMRPYFSGQAYVNYCDLDLPDWQTAYYGSNFKRLTTVKAAYDPANVFRFAQSIPPAKSKQ